MTYGADFIVIKQQNIFEHFENQNLYFIYTLMVSQIVLSVKSF